MTNPSSDISRASRRATVLFVSDDAAAQLAYQALASAGGLGVELGGDAHEALLLANLLSPDLVVLDVEASVRREILERLRASARTCSIPIVAILQQSSESFGEGPPIAAYLRKPCSSRRLLRILFLLLARRRAAEQEPPARRGVVRPMISTSCDGCGLDTPAMNARSKDAANAILRAAGWQSMGPGMYCPRCSTLPARAAANGRNPGVHRASKEEANSMALRMPRAGGEKA